MVVNLISEAVIWRWSVENLFFKLLTNSQENIHEGVSFLVELQPYSLETFLKRDITIFFIWIWPRPATLF